MCRRNLSYYDLRVCMELQVLLKTAFCPWFYAHKKYKHINSASRISTQRHICQSGSDNFSSGISGKLPKIATSNVIFLRTADPIAVKFCMTIKKIKPNDIFQNCVHSTSTLNDHYLSCIIISNFYELQFNEISLSNVHHKDTIWYNYKKLL